MHETNIYLGLRTIPPRAKKNVHLPQYILALIHSSRRCQEISDLKTKGKEITILPDPEEESFLNIHIYS